MEIINCDTQEVVLYQVKYGDNISTICSKFNVGENNIIRNNPNINFYNGEVIKIIRKNSTKHVVKPMETLSIIALKYSVDVDKIIKINNLSSKRLFVGQTLIIDNN